MTSYETMEARHAAMDRGELCPQCQGTDRIHRERAVGFELFVCACGTSWFDKLALLTSEAA